MLCQNEIIDLWQAGGYFREIAAEEIVKNFPAHASLFFTLLPQDNTGALVRHARGEFPFLMHGYQPAETYDLLAPVAVFDEFRQQETTFRQSLANHIASMPDSQAEDYKNIVNQYFKELTSYLPIGHECQRQLMIFVTGICNLKCPYCFSSDIEQKEISLTDLQRIFDWATAQGVKKITPCGGEPLMYRHFQDFINMAQERGMLMYFASNLTVPLDKFVGFDSNVMEGLYAHLTNQTLANPRLLQIFTDNIKYCLTNKIHVTGRLNIISTNPEELYPAIDLFKSWGIESINFSLTIPSTMASNAYMAIENVDAYIPTITAVINYASKLGMQAGIAKPLPLCRFDKSDTMRMLSAAVGAARCEIDSDLFMHNVSISPALEFSPCLGLEKITLPFSEDITWDQVRAEFAPIVQKLMAKPLYDQCTDCYLWKRRLCQGSCLTYKL